MEIRDWRPDTRLALCLFALLFSTYLLTFSGRYHSSDEMAMLVTTDSLARRGAWDIELLRWMGQQQGSFGPDGHLYSRKGIGNVLAALPFYWLALQVDRIGNVQAAMLTNGVVTALTGALVYLLLRRLRYGEGVSLGTSLAYGLGTMAWPYARYLFSESLAGLGLMLSACFLLRYRDRRDRAGPLLAGVGLGLALLARLNNAIVAPFLALLLLAYSDRPIQFRRLDRSHWQAWIRPGLLFGLPVLAALAISGWYNWLRFGSPLTTGYLAAERFATPFFEGFYGLTFSPGKGLFWYNPLLFAALAAWPAFFRRHRAEALFSAAVGLSSVAFYAPWYLWWAGHGWGPRFLVTMLPFATLPLASALEAASRRRTLAVGLGALAAVSVAVQVLGVAVDFNLYLGDVYAELGLYHPATLFNPAYSPLLRQITYLRPENLDLAWARGGSLDWPALLVGIGLVLASGLALGAARRQRLRAWAGGGLLVLLALGAIVSLLRYAPSGDVAEAADALAAMERPGESAALTDSLLTEAFQDAYDGHLWVWGARTGQVFEIGPVWLIGAGDPAPAVARFQVGAVRLDFYPPSGERFDTARLPFSPLKEKKRLGDVVELVAAQLGDAVVHPGETLPLTLAWRAVAPMDTSYTVFVQVINEDGVKAGQIDRLPCNGGCPTDTWRPGDLVGEWYDLPIRADAVPGDYQLIVGMYPSAPLTGTAAVPDVGPSGRRLRRTGDLATGETLPALDAQGNPIGEYLTLGSVQVEP